jgi:hypothetical protein
MSAPGRRYCHVCRHAIRGSQAEHNQTKEHRSHVIVVHRVTRKQARAAHRRRRTGRRQDEDYVSVVKHRRSPPDNGRRRTVHVEHYWRRLAGGRGSYYGHYGR